MTEAYCETTVSYLKDKLDELEDELKKEGRQVKFSPEQRRWNPTLERMANLEEIAQRAVPQLSGFISAYQNYVHDHMPINYRPIKVAVIDNGILNISASSFNDRSMFIRARQRRQSNDSSLAPGVTFLPAVPGTPSLSDTKFMTSLHGKKAGKPEKSVAYKKSLWARIRGGRSFVEGDSRVSPWLFASDAHGTQMANLICAIDPECELYVAKVADGRQGITPDRVARAINWAISMKVDIISMSFSLLTITDELENAHDAAKSAGIVMLCSTHDEGYKVNETWTQKCSHMICVTACDEYGRILRETTQKHQFRLRGNEVPAGIVPFLESSDRISGSSVSTATAAGLASLALSCHRLAGNSYSLRDADGKKKRGDIVRHYLMEMKADGGDEAKGYTLLLERFAGISTSVNEGVKIDMTEILKTQFSRKF